MPIMEWNQKLSVGVAELDAEHRKLVSMLNELYDAMQTGRGKQVLGRVLDGLIGYTRTHFDHEERLMARYGFPGLGAHATEHRQLTMRVLEVQREFEGGSCPTLSIEVMNFLWKWLANHIMVTDKGYSGFLNAKGVV